MEQPTQFYAITLAVALLGLKHPSIADNMWCVDLAWAYVGVRMVHSLVHCGRNDIQTRSMVFTVSIVVLLGLCLRAAMIIL
jgi:hypothetical protein